LGEISREAAKKKRAPAAKKTIGKGEHVVREGTTPRGWEPRSFKKRAIRGDIGR